jgi:hypothetical protein
MQQIEVRFPPTGGDEANHRDEKEQRDKDDRGRRIH